MIGPDQIAERHIGSLLEDYPFLSSFFGDNNLDIGGRDEISLNEFFSGFDEEAREDTAMDPQLLIGQAAEFIN